jgi:magnesium-transporting ATPase (P-type)
MIILLQVLLSIFGTLFCTIWEKNHKGDIESYLGDYKDDRSNNWKITLIALRRLGTWILIYMNMIPISMIATVESVKLAQAYFMQNDATMYDIE